MRRFLLALAMLAAAPLHAQEASVRTYRDGDAIVVSASVVVPSDVAAAWAVLTDYGRYAQFVPDLYVSRVRGRDARGLIVEHRGVARFLFLRHPVEATLSVVEVPERSVTSTAVEGSFREMTGRYELAPVEGGTRLTYAGRVVPGDGTPMWLTSLALKSNVERQFTALAREMARQTELSRLVQHPPGTPAN